ncbi:MULTISPECIES: TonB-dependent siderophore receptor [unclassified Rhizobacter]|uniref:TonB-dependent siderophore receptor n=1 Tax=unclassified Rhizobacter TaxID=2640088 RepID=UPI000700ED14|nr:MULTISPECIES: TonB-dependent siderophore receptor [unclassified Rhizobacter]KQU77949.1 TonB-dependent receptor [Rhizobacter sp. Root29]KQW15696.1 TonB-dependent receptor [Rhizobacter sp. Root1238]KRB24806.1 TonB-dependent receptor [Rhizobacter sp. Root16D2]
MKQPFLMTACAFAACVALGGARAQDAQTQDAQAPQAKAPDTTLDKVSVTGKRAHRVSKGATGLPMDVKETPQTISTIDQAEMADFGLTGSNEALGLATGINVEQYETNRATFNARGFEIQLTQVDGLGMTNSWGTVVGREDTFLFERIELIRGANGLLTGVGNASGTINYIRKRPKNEDGGLASVALGSYGLKRVALDYNKVLAEDGSWAGRFVVAHEDKDSWIRDLHNERTSLYGVVDGQVGTDGVLTLGVTAVDAKQDSPMWGSLTLLRSDGTQADFDVGSSTSQNWTYWNNKSYNAFVEYTHHLSADWEAKATYNYRHGNESTRLLYAYSLTGVLNPDNTGLVGWPYRSEGSSDNHVLDVNLHGEFPAFGRKHRLLVGLSQSREKTAVDTHEALTHAADPLPAFPYGGDVYAEPEWGPRLPSTRGEQKLTRLYAASHLTLTDSLKGVIGVNAVRLAREGASIYGTVATNTDYPVTKETSPYVGLTYDFTPGVLGYVSYSDIFQNQDQTDRQGKYLDPMKGVNTEVGVKAEWLDKALLTTFALFTAKQNGLATYVGTITDQNDPLNGQSWYEGKDVKSKGYEIEATGRIARDTKLTLGYTRLILTGPDGNDIYEWVPRNTVNFRIDTRVLPALRIGAGGRWQSEVHKIGSAKQEAFGVANAFAAYELTPAATLRLNVNNLFDKKYVTGLGYGAIYGAPRNVAVSLDYKL